MTIATVLEMAPAAVVLGLAIWAIAARETFAAVVGFIAYGLLLSLVWVRLDAVDVALTEAAIGGGLGGVLLLAAAARLKSAEAAAAAERPAAVVRAGAAVLSAMLASALAAAVLLLPDPVAHASAGCGRKRCGDRNGQSGHKCADPFRAMDTLLEKVVLVGRAG